MGRVAVPELAVSVRELAEFCHRRGDIDYRFTPGPTGEEGIAGHLRLQKQRGYEAEYALEGNFELEELALKVAGRADGYDTAGPLLEEIKTCRVAPDSIPRAPAAVHWAQLRIYGGLLCRAQPELEAVTLRLTYLQVDTDEEWSEERRENRDELRRFLDDSVAYMGAWLQRLLAWQKERNASLQALDFPFAEFRPGQRELAEDVYRCVASQGRLLLEAPTGTGKTLAVLFPALKALATGKHERLAYVTARTVGRLAAEEALRLLESRGMALRRLSVTAKETICFSPGKACHGDDCPFAKGYYDRLPEALAVAMQSSDLDRAGIERIAREHEVCPYQLSIDLLPWVDLCIGDIHYVYSFHATIAGLYRERRERWTVLLDEAHNLPERARSMYSAKLEKARLMAARREAGGGLRKALDACNRALLALNKEAWTEPDFDSRDSLPANLVNALQRFVAAVGERQAQQPLLLQRHPALLDFYFDVLQFQRVLDEFDTDFRFELHRERPDRPASLRLALRCLDASRLLAERQLAADAVVAFSATASPSEWMRDELGLGSDSVFRRIDSPFAAEQLRVVVDAGLDLRYRSRKAALPGVVAAIRRWLEETLGNCIIYFSAYGYMAEALQLLQDAPLQRRVLVQERGWREAERAELLDTLREHQDVAAFCILGGVFGEGIDLPGEALKSVVLVGVGLPQFSREREVLRAYYDDTRGSGFEYAYLFPGMQRVCQAMGRVIRQSSDTGSVLLIDRRYREPAYRDLLPPWWRYSGYDSRTGPGES